MQATLARDSHCSGTTNLELGVFPGLDILTEPRFNAVKRRLEKEPQYLDQSSGSSAWLSLLESRIS